jgi:hypothetical protein
VSVGIDQLAHRDARNERPTGRDDQQPVILFQVVPRDWLDTDGSAIELELDLSAVGQPDPVPQRTRDDQTSGSVDGSLHGRHSTMVVEASGALDQRREILPS